MFARRFPLASRQLHPLLPASLSPVTGCMLSAFTRLISIASSSDEFRNGLLIARNYTILEQAMSGQGYFFAPEVKRGLRSYPGEQGRVLYQGSTLTQTMEGTLPVW
jgi:hypothetical protein